MSDIILTYYVKQIQGKDKVLIKNFTVPELYGVISESNIRNIWINPIDKYMIINHKLKITNKHILPIKRDNKIIFIEAENMMIHDKLFNEDETFTDIYSLEQKYENINAYNIELVKDFAYFADSYLVHQYCDTCSGMSDIRE